MNNHSQFLIRLAIAGIAGVLIAIFCLSTGCDVTATYLKYDQHFTLNNINGVSTNIESFRHKTGSYPQKLAQLSRLSTPSNPVNDVYVRDIWRRPLVYKVQGNNYLLISYGRDGKPGGVGLDCDVSNRNPHPAQAAIPTSQILLHPAMQEVWVAALVCAFLTALLAFGSIKPEDLTPSGWGCLLPKLALTLISAGFVASIIASIDTSRH